MRFGSDEWTAALVADEVSDALTRLVRAAGSAERLRCQMALATPGSREHYVRAIAEFEADIEAAKKRIKAATCRERRAA